MPPSTAQDIPSKSLTFTGHIKATLVLGIPLILAQLAQMLMGVVDTIMLGWLGTVELAAGVLAFQLYFIFLILGLGIGAAMMAMIAAASGQGDERTVRRIARMGIWGLIGLSLLFQIPLYFTENILLLLGQDTELAGLAERYMRIAQWSMIPGFVLVGLRAFLTSIERVTTVLVITISMAVLNGILNYAFIFGNFGAPALGIEGAAVATTLAQLIATSLTIIYVMKLPSLSHYEMFHRFWVADREILVRIFVIGVPIALMIFAEVGLFAAASLLIGWIGTVDLAAHGIVLQIASLSFMVPLGLSQASSVRVGQAAGRGDAEAIGPAGYSAMTLALCFAGLTALLFWLAPEPLIRPFLETENADASAVLAIGVPLLAVSAAFQFVDSAQAIASGNLRGLQDTKVPLVIAIVCYWIVGMPVAYGAAFILGYGAIGVWGGLASALSLAAVLLSVRFYRRDRLGLAKNFQIA